MEQARPRTEHQTDASARRFKEQPEAEADRGDATITVTDRLGVVEEDRGSDPYNHTGRFNRSVR